MQKRSLGRRLWEIFSPILVQTVVTFAVEFVLVGIYCVFNMPEITVMMTYEEIMNISMEMMYGIYQYIVEIAAIAALATIPFLILMMIWDSKKDKQAGRVLNRKAPWFKYILVVGVSIPFALGLNNILTLSQLAEYSIAYQETAETLYAPSLPIQIICLGIIIPIMEECVFRGLIYKRIRRDVSVGRAVLLSAVLFGLYHGNLVQMIYGTLCGMLLAYLYEKFGSILAPILAHMLMNIVACLLTDVDAFTWMFSQPMRMALITVVCAAIASSMFVLIRQIKEKTEVEETEGIEVTES